MFGLCSSPPPLVGGGGRLVCKAVGKADLLNFDGKQSREFVDLPLTCHPSLSLTFFACRSNEVRHLLLDALVPDVYRVVQMVNISGLNLKLHERVRLIFRDFPKFYNK